MKGFISTISYRQLRLILLLSIMLTVSFAALSQNIEAQAARQYAEDFFHASPQKGIRLKSASSESVLTQCYQSPKDVKTPLYVFQQASKGFAMVAQSQNTYAIVGYSDDGDFQTENIPPQLRALMTFYEDSLQFMNPVLKASGAGNPVVPALLNEHGIKLNQYQHSEVGGSYTGCMATAITQIMLFHAAERNKLVKGYGSHCYTYGNYGKICADFENSVYNSNELLSYHVAVAMDMRFTTEGSSPPSMDKIQNIETHFKHFVKKSINENFYFKNELEHRRPVYASVLGVPENHAVVIDGYDSQDYFHLNYGWGGSFNGYFLVNGNVWYGTGNGNTKFHSNLLDAYIFSPSAMPLNVQDSLALVAVHNAVGGYEATKWDLTKPVWSWPGVLVMNDRVIRLTLEPAIPPKSVQSIAPEIGNLTALQELNLFGCFNGNIPSSITKLTDLKELNIANKELYIAPTLHKGNLRGEVPATIDQLTKLEWLSISNVLQGTIPTSIGNLANLRLLSINQDTTYFEKGNLSGSIPVEIGKLSKLQQFNISNQKLSGNIPSTIVNLSELTEINLSGNRLTGAVPAFNLPKLGYLVLNDNQFSGIAEGNGNCPNLKNIQLQNNLIKGSIPSYFWNFTALNSMNLSDNQINSLPEEIGNLTHLESLKIDNNQLQALPDEIALILCLKDLSAKNNQIKYMPSNFGQSRSLQTLDLSNNQITTIPEWIGNCLNLNKLILNNNKIDSIPETFSNIPFNALFYFQDNEMKGKIPEKLMTKHTDYLNLSNNRFVFNDIPKSDHLRFGVRDQKKVTVKKPLYSVQTGDTVSIDIRTITNLSHPDNEYYWFKYPELISSIVKDERFNAAENNPVLKIIVDAENVKNKYYCKVFNPNSPSFSFEYNGSTVTPKCLEFLNTETIAFQLATDEEIIAEKYTKEFVTSLKSITDKTISDGTVTLVPPLKIKRGDVQWEASADGINWVKVSGTMERADLKANVKSVSNEKLVLAPKNTAYYRCAINEPNCDPLYSDKLKVNALGKVLFDEIINVTKDTRTIRIDSIEVIVPQYFYDTDFRMTITKIENPPPSSAIFISGSVYDVTVSFGDTFNIPLIIKLKNIDKTKVNENEINRFEAVYFDDKNREWKPFENAHLSLKDSTINIVTNHLTKMKWWWYTEEYRMGYTDVYDRNNVLVFYNDDHANIMDLVYGLKLKSQPWHVKGTPKMVQDITEYLSMVMQKYKSLGLETPGGKFKVYMHNFKGEADGEIGVLGMLNGYMLISRDIVNPVELQQALAHEFMHYTQDYYISANGGNLFWMEAHATLSDRIVWDTNIIPVAESEEFLKIGKKSDKFPFANFLSNSWDYWDNSVLTSKMTGVRDYGYLAGTFLHYMRSYRKESKKLEPVTLLKETSWFGSWRTYLASYTSNHLDAILGDEYEEYVKFLLSGKNENFTLINKNGSPYAYLQDAKNKNIFTYPIAYQFKEGDEMVQKDEMDIKVPYMAAKIVLLENTNSDTLVLVNYKRKHEFDYDHLVYHVSYDHLKKEMTYVDISDSTEYNFLLEPRNKENTLTRFKNYSFLLLINKEYIGASSLMKDFNASFELTAMPVLNIENVAALTIYNGTSPSNHTFNNKQDYIMLGSPNAEFLKNATEFDVTMVNETSTKQIIDDHTYRIQTQYSLVIDQGQIKGMPTMKDNTTYTQTIDHDVVSGVLKITELEQKNHKLHTFIEFRAGPDGDVEEHLVYREYTDKIEERSKTYWLKDVTNYIQPQTSIVPYEAVYGESIIGFKTNNTAETQQVVTKIDGSIKTMEFNQKGELQSSSESSYLSTDFSNSNMTLNFIIRTPEE